MIDCYALSVSIKGGSSLCISECGGIQVTSGDILFLKAPLAQQVYNRYKPELNIPIPALLPGNLRHGHYEQRRLKFVLKPEDKKIEINNYEKKEPETKYDVVTDNKEESEIKDIIDNRSMNSPAGKKKRRTKRTKKKLTLEAETDA